MKKETNSVIEAVAQKCSLKEVLSETLQNLHFIKKETLTHVFFCEF